MAPLLGESNAAYRERIALLEAEALERRQQELGEQRSPSKTPADRIRIWERRHQLPLPRSPDHHLVAVIAANTGLTLDDVRAEQRLRGAGKATASAG
jgi:hypothetical protein